MILHQWLLLAFIIKDDYFKKENGLHELRFAEVWVSVLEM
jgi:hypothetical protein